MKEIKQTDPDEYTKWYSVESEKVKTNTPVIESSVVSLTNFRYALNHHTCNIMNAINRMYSFLYTSWYCWSNRDETEGTKINSKEGSQICESTFEIQLVVDVGIKMDFSSSHSIQHQQDFYSHSPKVTISIVEAKLR